MKTSYMNVVYLYIAILATVILQGCDGDFTRVVERDRSQFEPRGVVFGLLFNSDLRDTVFQQQSYGREKSRDIPHNRIYISNTSPDPNPDHSFYGSEVSMWSQEQQLALELFRETDLSLVKEPFYGVLNELKPGNTYKFKASYDEKKANSNGTAWSEISAIDSMPRLVQVEAQSAEIEYSQLNNTMSEGFVDIKIEDEPKRRNTYQIEIAVIQTTQTSAGETKQLIIPATVHGSGDRVSSEVFGNFQHHLIKETEFDNKGQKRIQFRFHTNHASFNKQKPVLVMIRLSNLSQSFVRYLESSRLNYVDGDNPFREPLEIYSNVHNGYGIFAFASRTFAAIKVES